MTIEESFNRLQEEHHQLQDDYAHLSMMFENMGKGYEKALKLYDQALESSRMKTDFIQQISHEIRTPLNILSGFTQVLTSGMELDEATQQEVTKGIVDNTDRNLMNGLVVVNPRIEQWISNGHNKEKNEHTLILEDAYHLLTPNITRALQSLIYTMEYRHR
jgi:nitrogen-specific signal transduction histidine kinase